MLRKAEHIQIEQLRKGIAQRKPKDVSENGGDKRVPHIVPNKFAPTVSQSHQCADGPAFPPDCPSEHHCYNHDNDQHDYRAVD